MATHTRIRSTKQVEEKDPEVPLVRPWRDQPLPDIPRPPGETRSAMTVVSLRFEKEESLSSGQRRSCCSLPGLPHHPGEICLAADSLFSRDEWLSRPSHRPGPGLPPSPTPFCFAADSLFSRDEWLSRPSHRPGSGLPLSPTPFL